MNRRYLVAGTVLSKRADNTYERFTNAGAEAAVNEVQTVTLVGPPTGGTWRAAFRGDTTGDLAYNISAAALTTALTGLASVGAANVTVTLANNAAGEPVYTITFGGALAGQDVPALAVDGTTLTGPGNQDAVVGVTTEGGAAVTQAVAGVLFDTVEFADGSDLSDEPAAMLRRNVSFKSSAIVDFAAYQTQIINGLPDCEFV